MANVELKNVTKIYDKKKITDNVSLEIRDKEFLVLIGSSGCGKSTLLRMIAGLEDISEGQILIDGKVVNDIPPKDRDIAFVFQNYALYPHMNVYENIAFPLKMRKMKKNDIDNKVNEAAEILNLTEYLKQKPKQLSGGQRQRVALGRAIVRNPKVFLMDEPLSNLDAKLRVHMRTEIKKLHQKLQSTFIYVTHDQTEALTMGDRIAVINNGVIQQTGTPFEVYNNPANKFTAGFLGSPSMNFIPCEINDGFININGQNFKLNENILKQTQNKKEIIIGIRPEHFNRENSDFRFNAKVEMTELLGGYKTVFFKVNGTDCTAILSADEQITDEYAFNSGKIMFFDALTGLRF